MGPQAVEFDIALYVALSEEFFAIEKDLGSGFIAEELPDVAVTCFLGSIASKIPNRSFTVVVVPAGSMGITNAAAIMSIVLDRYKPKNVVVIGIAGSLADELQPGDVFIPHRVNEYLANTATVADGEGGWTFLPSGKQHLANTRLLNRMQFLPKTNGEAFKVWRRKALERFKRVISDEAIADLKEQNLVIRAQSEMVAGDDRGLASGDAVGKGMAFVTWLKKTMDRKLAAIEMESAGVFHAAFVRIPAPRVLAIRGISDFADERKEILETAAQGGFRTLAIKNAITLFITAVKAGVFVSESPSDEANASLRAPPGLSLVKNVLVIGGETGETKHPDFEKASLTTACQELGKFLAKAGVRMLVCSPFTDSVDFYAVRGYARSGFVGQIEFHSPNHPDVKEGHRILKEVFDKSKAEIEHYYHPGYEDDASRFQAWLLSQLKALDKAEMVIAIGGRISNTASTVLYLAEDRGLPIVPYTFLKGAAQRAFARSGWEKLHPKIDPAILESEDGVSKVIEIANQLLIDKVSSESKMLSAPETVFISRAKEDADLADKLSRELKKARIKVLMGDALFQEHQGIEAAIERDIQESDLFIILWSKNYALSPWCYNELESALEHLRNEQLVIWLFTLDDTPILPRKARKLRAIRITSEQELLSLAGELLKQAGDPQARKT